MISNLKKSKANRLSRKRRIRKKVIGTAKRPRLTVYRSTCQTYAQVIDDSSGKTLVAASTVDKQLKGDVKGMKKSQAAQKVGEAVAKLCLDKKIDQVVFDRNGYAFRGRVAVLANAAREKGLKL